MKLVKPASVEEKQTGTTVDTIELTPKLVCTWRQPPFQREVKINAKVVELAEEIKTGKVLPGVLTIGVLDGLAYRVDGQHRLKAFEIAEIPVGYADVRTRFFGTMAEMADEFVRLNSALVRLRPDDIMRGMEPSMPTLQRLRKRCPYVGYDQVRRGDSSPVLSMSVFVRVWLGSRTEVPSGSFGVSSHAALADFTDEECSEAIDFASLCWEAWGRSPEFNRLWGTLNLILCAWTYRRIVLGHMASGNKRATRVTKELFRKGLLALSADAGYLEYLVGRNNSDRDRSPTYDRLKTLMTRRLGSEMSRKVSLPQPAWSHRARR